MIRLRSKKEISCPFILWIGQISVLMIPNNVISLLKEMMITAQDQSSYHLAHIVLCSCYDSGQTYSGFKIISNVFEWGMFKRYEFVWPLVLLLPAFQTAMDSTVLSQLPIIKSHRPWFVEVTEIPKIYAKIITILWKTLLIL